MAEPRTIGQVRIITLLLVAAGFMAVWSDGSRSVVHALPGAPVQGAAGAGDDGGAKGSVWVVNRDLGELAIFDSDTGTLIATRLVGAGAHDICISERAGKAYITAEALNTVTTVDTETLSVGSIPVGPLPHHCEPSHDGRSIFVTLASHPPAGGPAPGAPAYATIDTEDHSVSYTTTSANAAARTHAIFPTPDGERVFVAHDTGDEVTGVDVEPPNVFLSVSPIVRAEEVVATRFGDQLWVSSRTLDGTVKRIDIATQTITGSVQVGASPESVMLTPNERTLVVSLRGSPAMLAFVDTVNLALIGTVQIGPAGSSGDLAVMSGNGHYVFATFDRQAAGTGVVAIVDVRTRTIVRDWAYPGTGRPHGLWHSRKKPRF